MNRYTFAEISFAKRCFRVFSIVAKTEERARFFLRNGSGAAGLIGVKPTRAKKQGCRISLIRTREEWIQLCNMFDLTAEQGEAKL